MAKYRKLGRTSSQRKALIRNQVTCLLYTSWAAVVKPGRVMFEIAGVPEETAREALRLAMHKLPCKCKIVSRADLEGGDNSEN